MKRNIMPYYASCNCICKDHRNEMEAPDPVVKVLISYKIIRIMKRFDKKQARLIKRVSMGLSVWRETSKKLTVCREKGKKLTVCRELFLFR